MTRIPLGVDFVVWQLWMTDVLGLGMGAPAFLKTRHDMLVDVLLFSARGLTRQALLMRCELPAQS